tara:strand:- start:825 stop:1421 length:597 start_codon:yes stop_codon:yes gene_type:complete
MDIDNMLLDLEVIRQLSENDKLAVNIYPGVTTLIVDKSSYLSGITRKMNGYSRDESIKYLENLVQQIEKSCVVINAGSHSELAIRLQKSIKNAIDGLKRLQQTYQKDSIIVAKIVLIVNKLNVIVESLEFTNISFDELTKIESNQIEEKNKLQQGNGETVENSVRVSTCMRNQSNQVNFDSQSGFNNLVKSGKSNKTN